MNEGRRELLASVGAVACSLSVAGCSESTAPSAQPSNAATDDATTAADDATTAAGDAQPAANTSTSTDGEGAVTPEGGPNVYEETPADVDHVVAAEQVAFAPEELTVAVGDTVAFEHADGGAHTVTAREDAIPDDAAYWASGAFDSQDAAEAGFDEYDGVLSDGTTYVHTFDTPGRHEYYCIPHSHLAMDGAIVVDAD